MNQETIYIIDKMSEKLGTTAEHLFAVLIKQAPISSTLHILTLTLLIIIIYYVFKKVMIAVKEGCDSCFPLFIGALIISIPILFLLLNLDAIIAGFFNPEYWALKTILEGVRK